MGAKKTTTNNSADQAEKIRSLQEMIATAERTITSAKAMLAQVQGNNEKKSSLSEEKNINSDDNQIILGIFDGQVMQGEDGKQYPVPANYASKSKLVEGDTMKLTITQNGGFIYKQIGPTERKYLIGIVMQDEYGNYLVRTDKKDYRVLLAAATYFKIETGDEITIIVPHDEDAVWGAIENIVRKGNSEFNPYQNEDSSRKSRLIEKAKMIEEVNNKNDSDLNSKSESEKEKSRPSAIEVLEQEIAEERKKQLHQEDILDEWTPDIEEMKKETGKKSDKSSANKV